MKPPRRSPRRRTAASPPRSRPLSLPVRQHPSGTCSWSPPSVRRRSLRAVRSAPGRWRLTRARKQHCIAGLGSVGVRVVTAEQEGSCRRPLLEVRRRSRRRCDGGSSKSAWRSSERRAATEPPRRTSPSAPASATPVCATTSPARRTCSRRSWNCAMTRVSSSWNRPRRSTRRGTPSKRSWVCSPLSPSSNTTRESWRCTASPPVRPPRPTIPRIRTTSSAIAARAPSTRPRTGRLPSVAPCGRRSPALPCGPRRGRRPTNWRRSRAAT